MRYQDSICHLVDFINAHLGDDEEREPLDASTQNNKVCSKKQLLSDMGYELDEICHAIEICGEDSDFDVLVDFIYATYGYKKESKVLDFNGDLKKPISSSGLDNIITDSDSKTNDENSNVPFNYKWSSTSSDSSEDVSFLCSLCACIC
ncbi:hypothetical protein L7F22_006277 [Adiantum nelumboides]|nr:hypothetical protein [Adiantum nelumboides]